MKNSRLIPPMVAGLAWLATAPLLPGVVLALYDFSEFTAAMTTAYTNVTATPYSPYVNQASSVLATPTGLANVSLDALAAAKTRDNTAVELGSPTLLMAAGGMGLTSPASTSDYLQTTLTAAAPVVYLTAFAFDLGTSAGANTNASGVTTVETRAQLYCSTDGGSSFATIGPLHESIADNAANTGVFTGMNTYTVDLTSLAPLTSGQSIVFRLGFGDNRGSATTAVGHYLDNVTINGVPEPAAGLLALAAGGIALLRRRRG